MKGTVASARFHNARIYTFDAKGTVAQAVACCEGRVAAVGTDGEVRERFRRLSEVDLGGAVVLPAFCDAHVHLLALGLQAAGVSLDGAATKREAVDRVQEAARAAAPGRWVVGRGWDASRWPEGLPTRADLDPAVPHPPVVLWSKDGHRVWCNSAALEAAGITASTPDPPGGRIVRDPAGVPTGVLEEAAASLVAGALPPPSDADVEAGLLRAQAELHRVGAASAHNMTGPTEGAEAFYGLQRLRSAGQLRLRVVAAIPEAHLDAAAPMGLRAGLGDGWLRLGFVKVFADGTLGSQTAAMLDPYSGRPHDTGIAVHTREELIALVRRASEAGWACAVHAIGDRANRWALDAFEASLEHSRRLGLRHRIEHAQLVHPADVSRFAWLGVVASMQPVHCPADRSLAERHWGERCRYAYAWRSLLQSGAVLAFGSDAPVETPDVLRGLYAAVFRKHPEDPGLPWFPEQALTVEEAVRAYTFGPAYAAGAEAHQGSLEVEKACDFVVLDRDVLEDPQGLASARVRMTVVGGEVVYPA